MNLAIFDIDGTLTQTNEIDAICYVQTLEQLFNIKNTNTHWEEYTETTDSGILNEIFQNNLGYLPSKEDIRNFQIKFVQLLSESYQLNPDSFQEIPGTSSTLKRLEQSQQWVISIGSGGWRISALLKLKFAHLDIINIPGAFADDHISREGIIRKSIQNSQQFYQIENFDKIVYIGDAIWDLRTTRKMQIPFLGIAQNGSASKLQNEGAKYLIPDFQDYDRFLQLLNQMESGL